MVGVPCRLLLVTAFCFPLLAAAEEYHRVPVWPTDEDFIKVNRVVEAACKQYPTVDKELVWAVIWKESKYDRLVEGASGEVGLGQLMPETAKRLGVQDRTSVTESVYGIVRLLGELLNTFKGNTRLAIAAYNSKSALACKCIPTTLPRVRAYVEDVEQSRLFAQRIVAYIQSSLLPSEKQQARVTQLQKEVEGLQAQNKVTDSTTKRELQKAQTALKAAREEADALRAQRDTLQAQLQRDNLGALALAMAETLDKRLDEVEDHLGDSAAKSRSQAEAELYGIRGELAELKSAVQARNIEDNETKKRIAELSIALARLSERTGDASNSTLRWTTPSLQTADSGNVPRATFRWTARSVPSTTTLSNSTDGAEIMSVGAISTGAIQKFAIKGMHFGAVEPFNGCSWFIRITNLTSHQEFGHPAYPRCNSLRITSWTDTEIQVEGFAPFKPDREVFSVGDVIKIEVANPRQQGWVSSGFQGSPVASYSLRVTSRDAD